MEARKGLLAKLFTVLAGGVLAQLITFASTPWVTRLYSPDEFGIFSNVAVLAGFLMPLLSLSLPMALVMARGKQRSRTFAIGTIIVALCNTLIILLLCLIIRLFEFESVSLIAALATLFGFVIALQESVMYLYIKEQYYVVRSFLLILQAIVIAGMKIGFGQFDNSASALVWSSIIGYSVVNLLAFIHLKLFKFRFSSVKTTAFFRSNIHFVKFRTPQNLLSNFNLLVPVSVLTYFFSPSEAGLYALARTVVILPATMLGKSITDVFYPKMAKAVKNGHVIERTLKNSMVFLCCVSVVPLIVLEWQGDYIFDVVFGPKWGGAADYAKWVMVWVVFNIINKPCAALIPVFNLEKSFLKNSVLNFIFTCAGLAIGVFVLHSPLFSIMWMSILTIVPQLMIVIIVMSKVKAYEKK